MVALQDAWSWIPEPVGQRSHKARGPNRRPREFRLRTGQKPISRKGLPANWLEHDQLLTKVYDANDVIIYFDRDMDRSHTWLNDYVSRLWKYTKQT